MYVLSAKFQPNLLQIIYLQIYSIWVKIAYDGSFSEPQQWKYESIQLHHQLAVPLNES